MRSRMFISIALVLLLTEGFFVGYAFQWRILTKDKKMDAPSGDVSAIETVTLSSVESSGFWNNRITALARQGTANDEDLAELLTYWREVNASVDAILVIPELEVCEPVLCGAPDNYAWLRTNIYGQQDKHGAVFLDYRCNISSSAIKLLHGHNMADNTMFGRVPEYLLRNRVSDIQSIYLYVDAGKIEYAPTSIISIDSTEETLPINPLVSVNELGALANDLLDRSVLPGGTLHSLDLLVLNTCWYGATGSEHNLHCIAVFSKV